VERLGTDVQEEGKRWGTQISKNFPAPQNYKSLLHQHKMLQVKRHLGCVTNAEIISTRQWTVLFVMCCALCGCGVGHQVAAKFIWLTPILLTWRIRWAPDNASGWQMGFNWALKVLSCGPGRPVAQLA